MGWQVRQRAHVANEGHPKQAENRPIRRPESIHRVSGWPGGMVDFALFGTITSGGFLNIERHATRIL
jgi:hypothetical protein